MQAIHQAIMFDDTCTLSNILNMNFLHDISYRNDDTPLVLAAGNGKVKCTRLLIERKADIEVVNKYGGTALHRAAYKGQAECLQVLIEANAELNVRAMNGSTALGQVCSTLCELGSNQFECVRLLLEAQADVNIATLHGNTPLLSSAKYCRDGKIAEALIRFGADIDISNKQGETALSRAKKYNNTSILEVLCRYNVEKKTNKRKQPDMLGGCQ